MEPTEESIELEIVYVFW